MKAIINAKIYDYKHYIENGFAIFDQSIDKVGEMKDFNDKNIEEIIDAEGKLLMPGLINFHTHIYSMLIRGYDMKAHPVTFRDVLDQIWWKFDSHLTLDDLKASAYLYSIESLEYGVTSLIDHNASGQIEGSLDALKEGLLLPAALCFETSDRFDVSSCIKENTENLFGLHASLSLGNETLKKISNHLSGTNQPIHIHVAESQEDEDDSLRQYSKRVVHRLNDYSLLGKNSILAHCVHIDDSEAKIIADKQCFIALNPTSNMNNAVGTFNYSLFKKHHIGLLVGTDGLGSNIAKAWQNLYYAGKQSMRQPDGIPLGDMLNHITESYEYYSNVMKRPVGQIKAGYMSDFVILDYTPPTPLNKDNVFGHVFYGVFDRFRPESVFVSGEQLLHHYAPTFQRKNYQKQVINLWNRIGGIL